MLMALLEPGSAPAAAGNYRLYEPLTRHLSSLSDAALTVARRLASSGGRRYLRRAFDRPRRLPQPRRRPAHGHPGRYLAGGGARLRRRRAGDGTGSTQLPPGWRRLSFRFAHRARR
jgi:hypothetical protein